MSDLFAALALALAIEGAAYALFPDRMKAAMVQMLKTPSNQLRMAGIVACIGGLAIIWMVRR